MTGLICNFKNTKPQQKSKKRLMGQNHHKGNKKERPKKGQKMNNPQDPKKGKELVLLMVGSYLTHGPFNVTYIQIVRCNNSGDLKQASPANAIFFLIVEVKAC
jgi:hypothetical protein